MDTKCYIPQSESDVSWGIGILGAGCSSVPANYRSYPVSIHPSGYQFSWKLGRTLRDEYQLVYIARGRGIFESSATNKLKIEAGCAFLLFPGIWHRYRPAQATGWDDFWIGFKGDVIDRLVEDKVLSPQEPVLNVGLSEELINQFLQVIQLAELQPVGFKELLATRSLLLLSTARVLAQQQMIGNLHLEELIRKARLAIIEQFDSDIDMAQLARQFHLSYPHFRRLFKRYTGLAPNQYQLLLRLSRAKDLLHSTDLSIKQICTMLGFADPYYFSKLFKKKNGVSPHYWRHEEPPAPEII